MGQGVGGRLKGIGRGYRGQCTGGTLPVTMSKAANVCQSKLLYSEIW